MSDRVRRLILDAEVPQGASEHRLGEAAAHYVTRVLRLAEGARVEALDLAGRHLRATLVWREGDAWLEGVETMAAPAARTPLVVIAALIKPNRWEWMLEKAAELGATDIVPLRAARSVIKLPAERVEGRVARWQKIVDGATRQCGRLDRVTVHPPASLSDAQRAWATLAWAHADEAANLDPWPAWPGESGRAFVIGPEGGFTEEERQALRAEGARPIGLGASLLRAETAAVCVLSALRLRDAGLLP